MASLNKVMLIGNLGKDPEVRTIPSGAKVANFPIATSESYTGKDGNRVEKTEWHNIVMWRGLAEVAEKYLKKEKGNPVFIEGKLQTRSWDDQNGQKRYMTEIIADNMTMLGGRRSEGGDFGGGDSEGGSYGGRSSGGYGGGSGGSGGGCSKGGSSGGNTPPPPEDDLPF